MSRDNWPEIQQFSDYRYAEIGWGDEGFYRMDGLKIGTAVNAAFWPSPSVLHVAAFDVEPDLVFEHSDVVAIELEQQEFESLCRFIAGSAERNAEGRADDLGEGRYGFSRFFRGRESYYLPKTCNVWTADALRQANQPFTPSLCVTAETVVRRGRGYGRVLSKSDAGLKRAMLRAETPNP